MAAKAAEAFESTVLGLCCASLAVKAHGHVWLPDGAGATHGGFDYTLGNADVIVTVLFAYGVTQYAWLAHDVAALLSGDRTRRRWALAVHGAAAVFVLSFATFAWDAFKGYPLVGPPKGGALRPGQYLWIGEAVLSPLALLVGSLFGARRPSNSTRLAKDD